MTKPAQSSLVLLFLTAWVVLAPFAASATRVELYQVTVPRPEKSEASQDSAFQAALGIVLVRVTGRRTAAEDAVFAPLMAEARRYVQQYRATPDNQFWVAFDGNAISRWLAQNGQPIWGRDRPATFVWLAMPAAGTLGAAIATSDASADLKAAIDAEAAVRGIPLRWPTVAELQNNRLDYTALVNAPNATLMDLGKRLGAEAVLIGRPAMPGSAVAMRWVLQFQDRTTEFAGTTEGIDGAADLYAGLFAASGAPSSVDIEVAGLADVGAYAKVQSYLESLTFVQHVGVRAVNADRVTFHLTVRGGGNALQRALVANAAFEAMPATDGAVLHYQLRP